MNREDPPDAFTTEKEDSSTTDVVEITPGFLITTFAGAPTPGPPGPPGLATPKGISSAFVFGDDQGTGECIEVVRLLKSVYGLSQSDIFDWTITDDLIPMMGAACALMRRRVSLAAISAPLQLFFYLSLRSLPVARVGVEEPSIEEQLIGLLDHLSSTYQGSALIILNVDGLMTPLEYVIGSVRGMERCVYVQRPEGMDREFFNDQMIYIMGHWRHCIPYLAAFYRDVVLKDGSEAEKKKWGWQYDRKSAQALPLWKLFRFQ